MNKNYPTQEELEAFAHRTSTRYKHNDAWPYQFAAHNLPDFARQIIDWRDDQAAKQEPVYQLKSGDGKWIEQAKHSYEYNLKNGHEVRTLYAAPMPAQAQEGWVKLSDSQWVNIVNHDRAYESHDKESAVHLAVQLTEARLKMNNAAPMPAQAPVTPPEMEQWPIYGDEPVARPNNERGNSHV